MRFDMTAIDRLTQSARRYKFAVAMAAAGLFAPLFGDAQTQQPQKQKLGGVGGRSVPVHTKKQPQAVAHDHTAIGLVGVKDTVFVAKKNDMSVPIDSTANIYYHHDVLNNASVFTHYVPGKINHVTRVVGMSNYYARHLDTLNAPTNRWAIMELADALALGAETPKMKGLYKKGAHYMNPRHTYYMATGQNRADVRQQAGRYYEWGAVGPNIITEKLGVPDRINQHLTMRAAYRLYTQDPNALGASWSFKGPWQQGAGEFLYIPNHAILAFGVETGANSPLILGAEAGFDVYWGNTVNFLNFASPFTNVYGGVRFFPKSVISIEATAHMSNTLFNQRAGFLMQYDADRGRAMGYQIRATARLGNIIKDKGFKRDQRAGFYAGSQFDFSGNATVGGAPFYAGLTMANPVTGVVLGERANRFFSTRIGLSADHVMASMGLETPASSWLVAGIHGGAKAYVNEANGLEASSRFAKAEAGFRLNSKGVFALELVGYAQQQQFRDHSFIQYPQNTQMSSGIEIRGAFRPGFIKK